MNRNTRLETYGFPLESTSEATGPAYRQAHEIGRGAVVIRTTKTGPEVCLKLERPGYDFLHHYVIALDFKPREAMRLVYVDPEEMLFDCLATLELDCALVQDGTPEVGHLFENSDGLFIKVMDNPKTQKMFGFVEPATGMVRLRQEHNLKGTYPDWSVRVKVDEEIIDFPDLLERFLKDI